jgi:iron complex transport system ATP-binding protein
MFTCKDLYIGYEKNPKGDYPVAGLNLILEPGTLTLLAGTNGSGKSSLLCTLAGLQESISGEISFAGQLIHSGAAEINAQHISIMFSTPPHLEYSLAQEVVLSGMSRFLNQWQWDYSDASEKALTALSKTGAEVYANKPFAALSDGEKQKVMLARCLAQNTPVILLDEPLAFLDYPSRQEMLNLLRNIALEEHKIILFSSHDIEISLPFSDNLLFLKGNGSWYIKQGRTALDAIVPSALFTEQ